MRENLFHFLKELTWWIITAMVVAAVMYPVTSRLDFTYWKIFAVFVFITLTYFRYTLTLRSLQFLRPAWARFLLFTLNLTLFVFLMYQEQKLISMADNFDTLEFGFPKVIMYDEVKAELLHYLRSGIVFWGTGSLLMIAAFQLRLIVSYWQYYQRQSKIMMEE